jgi:hypothetical protein
MSFITFFIDHLRATSNTDSFNVTICLSSTEFSKRDKRKLIERFTRLKIHWHYRIAFIEHWEMKVFQVIGIGRYWVWNKGRSCSITVFGMHFSYSCELYLKLSVYYKNTHSPFSKQNRLCFFYVFLTVHHSIDFFNLPTLMHNSFIH